jgi:hypothetical protein
VQAWVLLFLWPNAMPGPFAKYPTYFCYVKKIGDQRLFKEVLFRRNCKKVSVIKKWVKVIVKQAFC